ncbi:hypothetical protein Taro_006688 [Colocasia esculenta]|uniref:Uncharacterized protein n=1 Tax=Colocasia esculenta TaxID=4460 RepID=A0A843TW02_COLES|nr:hypothetical protein [Colocasia esculenta]
MESRTSRSTEATMEEGRGSSDIDLTGTKISRGMPLILLPISSTTAPAGTTEASSAPTLSTCTARDADDFGAFSAAAATSAGAPAAGSATAGTSCWTSWASPIMTSPSATEVCNIYCLISTQLRLHKREPLLLLGCEKLSVVAPKTTENNGCGHGFGCRRFFWRDEMVAGMKALKKFFTGRRERLQICKESMPESLGYRLRQANERGKKSKDRRIFKESKDESEVTFSVTSAMKARAKEASGSIFGGLLCESSSSRKKHLEGVSSCVKLMCYV